LCLALLLYPLPKVDIFLDNDSSSKEKSDNSAKNQTKKSRNSRSAKKIKDQSISKGAKTQATQKNQAKESVQTRATAKTKKTPKQFSPSPATSSVLDKIIPSQNDISKKSNIAVPKKSKRHSFLKLFLTDFVQSVIREELEKKAN
jgi:hypothetical protein